MRNTTTVELDVSRLGNLAAVLHARHRTVGEVMQRDHQRLERVLAKIEWEASQRLFARARQRAGDQRATGDQPILVRTPVEAHSILQRMLDEVGKSVTAKDLERADGALADLRDILVSHARIERTQIDPAVDVSEANPAALVVAMQEM